jgi:sedoheptulose-bisphosphatase
VSVKFSFAEISVAAMLGLLLSASTALMVPTSRSVPASGSVSSNIRMADVGAASTAFYTDAVAKDSYPLMPDVLSEKCADADLRKLMLSLFDAFATVSEALSKELVVKAAEQKSVFGDVQLGVDVLADDLMWDVCKGEPLIKEGASEEEPEVREMHADGKFSIVWDPLDGSAIVDNNWAVGTIIGIWPASTGIVGATGRDQVASMVANYGPRTTAFVTLDDGVYEFTLGVNGIDGWLCSRERVQIKKQSKIFSPANLRTARHELPGYGELIDYWLDNRYTLRFCGGLVPDLCQQFSKGQGILTNPPGGDTAPAKLRLAFECAPFSKLIEMAGGKSSDAVTGGSILDMKIDGIDQRTSIAIGSAEEVDRFNNLVLPSVLKGPIPYVDGQKPTYGLSAGNQEVVPALRPDDDAFRYGTRQVGRYG